MNSKHLVIIAGLLVFLLSSCATTQKDKALTGVKRIGIINLFPDKPRYSKFMLLNDVTGEAELPEMRNYLTQKFIASLVETGVEAQGVRDHLPLLRGEVDVILELQPRIREQHDPGNGIRYDDAIMEDGSNGFGFFYKSLLLTKTGPESYVAMRIVAVENKAGALVPISEHAIYKREKLNLPEIPNSWRQLSDSEKQEMEFGLRRTIDDSVTEILTKFGF